MKYSLNERLQTLKTTSTDNPFSGETVACAMHGFGQLSDRTAYMDWLGKALLASYKADGDYPYENLVHHADKLIHLDSYITEGYELMFQLLIEPLYSMSRHKS